MNAELEFRGGGRRPPASAGRLPVRYALTDLGEEVVRAQDYRLHRRCRCGRALLPSAPRFCSAACFVQTFP